MTEDEKADDFFVVAVAHGLLQREQVEEISELSSREGMHASDAALSLSAMQAWEVDATRLLMDAKELAPGFELTGLIGCGAAGMVFRAHQSALNREVALKTINVLGRSASTGESRIQHEAKAIAKLQHPNIVAAYDSGFYKGRFCIAMELIEGETLADFISREAPVAENVAWQIARQAAAALSHAESVGIIHRDIKPANLLLCSPPAGVNLPAGIPFVKVVDFGLALDELHEMDDRLTVTGATLGTPAYVAPEQLENSSVDCRADIYALGATVFHMLTADAPFSNQSPMKAILQKTIGDTTWRDTLPTSTSEATAALLRDMTEADIDERTGDYETLIQRIDDILNGVPYVAPQPSKTQRAKQPETEVSNSSQRTKHQGQFAGRGLAFGGLVLCALTIIGLTAAGFLPGSGATSDEPNAPSTTEPWTPVGPATALFNGRSVPFRLLTPGSQWMPATEPNLAGILMGTERSSLTIPLNSQPLDPQNGSPHARLLVNVYLPDKAAQTEVILKKTSSEASEITVGTLSISDGRAEFFDSSNAPNKVAVTVEFSKVDPKDVVPHAVEIRRDGNRVRMSVKGDLVADFEASAEDTFSAMFKCTKIGVGLCDLTVVKLKPAGP